MALLGHKKKIALMHSLRLLAYNEFIHPNEKGEQSKGGDKRLNSLQYLLDNRYSLWYTSIPRSLVIGGIE